MLMPGLGERGISVRVRLVIALVLTLVMLPLYRDTYSVTLYAGFAPILGVLIQEVLIGAVLGLLTTVTGAFRVGIQLAAPFLASASCSMSVLACWRD
jgi:flagellar biosynthesis protein FliR